MIKPLLIALLLALGACGGSETPGPTVDGGGFGATCMTESDMSTECASGICTNSFDMIGHPVCSQKCTVLGGTDTTCPQGPSLQKCNMKGYCKP
jgi:hypothetical protein